MPLTPLRSVTFTFVEPPTAGIAGTIHSTWQAADEALRWLPDLSPLTTWRLGFVIEWADGRSFRGQGEFTRDAITGAPLCAHVRRVLAILAGRRRPTPLDEHQYRRLLAGHGGDERNNAADLLDNYDVGSGAA